MGLIVLIVAILVFVGVVPFWSYSRKWGYGPMGIMGLFLGAVVALMFMGVIPRAF